MKTKFIFGLIIGLLITAATATVSTAQVGGRATSRQMDRLLTRIETRIDTLKDEADRYSDTSTNVDNNAQRLIADLTTLEQSTSTMHENLDARGNADLSDDATRVLTDAVAIDRFITRNRVSTTLQSQWKRLKTDLDTLAQYNRISWNWNRPPVAAPVPIPSGGGYTVTDAQMRTLLSRIDLKTGIYRSQMDAALRTDTSAAASDRSVRNDIVAFQTAVNTLQARIDRRQASNADADDILMRATSLDQFMNRNRLTTQVQAQWRSVRADLNTLASYYRLSWNWNQSVPGSGGSAMGDFDTRITGTYRLNASLSEDAASLIDRSISSAPQTTRENSRRSLERRLRAPEMLAIEMRGKGVTMASSILPQVSFQADGVARAETNARGRSITTTATADDDGLIINYQGERSSDFFLTFLPMPDGRLKMTRRIYVDDTSESVTVSSVYDKIDPVARWSSVTTGNNGGTAGTVNETYTVPAGTRLSAELSTAITGSGPEIADRFSMEVTSPGQYRRAVISGRILAEDSSSRVANRTRVLLAFDTIRLPNGQTYRFAGNVDAVTAVNGDPIQVTNQIASTRNTSTRGTGGILGALIGAISGVPVDSANATTSGAVLMQRRETMDIGTGSQILLTASQPIDR